MRQLNEWSEQIHSNDCSLKFIRDSLIYYLCRNFFVCNHSSYLNVRYKTQSIMIGITQTFICQYIWISSEWTLGSIALSLNATWKNWFSESNNDNCLFTSITRIHLTGIWYGVNGVSFIPPRKQSTICYDEQFILVDLNHWTYECFCENLYKINWDVTHCHHYVLLVHISSFGL